MLRVIFGGDKQTLREKDDTGLKALIKTYARERDSLNTPWATAAVLFLGATGLAASMTVGLAVGLPLVAALFGSVILGSGFMVAMQDARWRLRSALQRVENNAQEILWERNADQAPPVAKQSNAERIFRDRLRREREAEASRLRAKEQRKEKALKAAFTAQCENGLSQDARVPQVRIKSAPKGNST